jgi:hypothetical protein
LLPSLAAVHQQQPNKNKQQPKRGRLPETAPHKQQQWQQQQQQQQQQHRSGQDSWRVTVAGCRYHCWKDKKSRFCVLFVVFDDDDDDNARLMTRCVRLHFILRIILRARTYNTAHTYTRAQTFAGRDGTWASLSIQLATNLGILWLSNNMLKASSNQLFI